MVGILLISIISACTVVLVVLAVLHYCKPHFNYILSNAWEKAKEPINSKCSKLRNTYETFVAWFNCKQVTIDKVSFEQDIVFRLSEILYNALGDSIPSSVEKSPVKPFIADMNKIYQRLPAYCNRYSFLQGKENILIGLYDTKKNDVLSPIYFASNSVDNRLKDEMGDEIIIIVG